MYKFKPYQVETLPTGSAIDLGGIYFRKLTGENYFSIHIRKADDSGWVTLADIPVNSVNGMTGAVSLELALNATTGVLSLTGSGTTINLDSRYTKNTDDIDWSRLTGKPTTRDGYGITDVPLDSQVVHKTGDENITGTKAFFQAPTIINPPTAPNHATNKQYVDTQDAGLQTQIESLTTTVLTGVRQAEPIDCSANPNYPVSDKGDRYRVTVPGKIGGASGIAVTQNDIIECINKSESSGTHSEVGANFIIQQANIDSANESTEGYIRKATIAEGIAGSSDVGAMTPLKVQSKINATAVKYDVAQALTEGEKEQARTNIEAVSESDIEWIKEW